MCNGIVHKTRLLCEFKIVCFSSHLALPCSITKIYRNCTNVSGLFRWGWIVLQNKMLKRKSLKKKKKPEPEEVPNLLQEGLPQVWLAVTPEQEIDHLQNAGSQGELKPVCRLLHTPSLQISCIFLLQKKKVVIKESVQDPQQGGYLHDDILEPQEVTAIGWEDEDELDYTKIAGQDSNTPGLPVLPVVRKSSIQTTDLVNFQRRPSGEVFQKRSTSRH